jgi:glutaminyl-tRNA synthetase
LFKVADPDRAEGELAELLNPDSLEVVTSALVEPALADAELGEPYQFERQGYFKLDEDAPPASGLAFSRTVTLRDSWAKLEKQALATNLGSE